jgi:hypothetical protein
MRSGFSISGLIKSGLIDSETSFEKDRALDLLLFISFRDRPLTRFTS